MLQEFSGLSWSSTVRLFPLPESSRSSIIFILLSCKTWSEIFFFSCCHRWCGQPFSWSGAPRRFAQTLHRFFPLCGNVWSGWNLSWNPHCHLHCWSKVLLLLQVWPNVCSHRHILWFIFQLHLSSSSSSSSSVTRLSSLEVIVLQLSGERAIWRLLLTKRDESSDVQWCAMHVAVYNEVWQYWVCNGFQLQGVAVVWLHSPSVANLFHAVKNINARCGE